MYFEWIIFLEAIIERVKNDIQLIIGINFDNLTCIANNNSFDSCLNYIRNTRGYDNSCSITDAANVWNHVRLLSKGNSIHETLMMNRIHLPKGNPK